MIVALKALSKNVKEASVGLVNLTQKDGSKTRRALLCRTGSFDGMYGPITVTRQMLLNIAERHNLDRANPQNENDYPPILKDHVRLVDLVQGRILVGLSVEEWTDPSTNHVEWGLFGDLRIDDDDAKKNVESGKYAHLSISFDEETFELFEVSFVAVEAARRSILLSQGANKMDFQKKYGAALATRKKLSTVLSTNRAARKQALSHIASEQKKLHTEATELQAKAQGLALTLKAGQVKAQLSAFIRAGKVNPAELQGMDFKALAQAGDVALKAVLKSYEDRQVMTDVHQHGQVVTTQDALPVNPTAAQTRAAIKLQREGKKATNLSEGDVVVPPKKDDPKKDDPAVSQSYSMGEDEYKECLSGIEGAVAGLSGIFAKLKALSEKADELAAADDKAEEEETKLSAENQADEQEEK